MNRCLFADLTRSLRGRPSRRDMVQAMTGLGLGLSLVGFPDPGAARKKRKHKHKRKKHKKQKVLFNAFGCVDAGTFCQNNAQCCSGICAGTDGKKTCQSHDTGGCQLADSICVQENVVLCPDIASGVNKLATYCFQTTGNAPFCGFRTGTQCVACAKDADCVAEFGVGAACVVCVDDCAESNGTTCMPAAS